MRLYILHTKYRGGSRDYNVFAAEDYPAAMRIALEWVKDDPGFDVDFLEEMSEVGGRRITLGAAGADLPEEQALFLFSGDFGSGTFDREGSGGTSFVTAPDREAAIAIFKKRAANHNQANLAEDPKFEYPMRFSSAWSWGYAGEHPVLSRWTEETKHPILVGDEVPETERCQNLSEDDHFYTGYLLDHWDTLDGPIWKLVITQNPNAKKGPELTLEDVLQIRAEQAAKGNVNISFEKVKAIFEEREKRKEEEGKH